MDFWTSVWVAVVSGVVLFLLTVVPYDLLTRSKRATGPTIKDSSVTSGDGPVVTMNGDGDGDRSAKVKYNHTEKHVTNKNSTTINNPPLAASEDDTTNTIGMILGILGAVIVTAVLFVLYFQILFWIYVLATAVVLGLIVNVVTAGVRAHGWNQPAKTLTALTVVTATAITLSWIGIFTTVRNVLHVEAMQRTIVTTPNPAGTNRGMFQRLADQVQLFLDVYGMPGVSFAVLLFLGVAAAGVLLVLLVTEALEYRRYIAAIDGRIPKKKARKRALAHGTRSGGRLAVVWGGTVAVAAIALMCSSGLAFDLIQAVQAQRINIATAP
ncbi:hypothetical protein ACFWN7_10530 [Agromyces sp. NPDC058484]|uniref:hypothetical protein n=1 Tax=Agromyces sp. NPDC058484 TaxID=3346524 RepID=UPI0036570DC1